MPWRAGAKVDARAPDCGPSQPILIGEPSVAVLPLGDDDADDDAAVVLADDPPAVVVAPLLAAVVAPPLAAVVAALPLELLSLPQAATATSSDALHNVTPSRTPNLRRPLTVLSSPSAARIRPRTLMLSVPLLAAPVLDVPSWEP